MSETPATIKVFDNGPYKIKNFQRITFSDREPIELSGQTEMLCGCGHSQEMPFCDGAHARKGFESLKSEDRILSKDKDYIGEAITVHFDLSACAHVAICIRELPEVFDVKKRPWINADGADAQKIVAICRACPSGALSYTLKGEARVDSFESEVKLVVDENGPLEVWGGVEIEGAEAPKVADHYTLCRCGASKNHPYCDGTHHKVKFKG